jgi:hypothetical protein
MDLRLADTTGGDYGETALSVEDKLKKLFPTLRPSNKPSVVWLCDVSDDKSVNKIERVVMRNEPVGIALKRFNCFRVHLLEMPEGDLRKKYEKEAPALYFFDPAVKQTARLTGKRATSLSAFNAALSKTWSATFTMPLKKFQKSMKDILDRLDKLDGQKTVLNRKRSKLAEKPNPSKQRALDADLRKFEEARIKVEEDEQALEEKCTLKPQFLPEKDGE